jgi:guanosine-3',5'-bis(diphosphate) 3'-pyrophosphohydrolase
MQEGGPFQSPHSCLIWIKFGIFKEKSGMEIQAHYQEAIKFAAYRHLEKKQKVKGTKLPYVVHLSNVAMEIMIAAPHSGDDFDLDFAIRVALLHDLLEDTL